MLYKRLSFINPFMYLLHCCGKRLQMCLSFLIGLCSSAITQLLLMPVLTLKHNASWSNWGLLYLILFSSIINQAVTATCRAQGSAVIHCLGDAQKTEGCTSRVVDKLNVHKRNLTTALMTTFL